MTHRRCTHCWVWMTDGFKVRVGCAHCRAFRSDKDGDEYTPREWDWTPDEQTRVDASREQHKAQCPRASRWAA